MQQSRGGFVKILGLVAVIVVVGFAIFMLTFEKEAPEIHIKENAVWNLKDSFSFEISDNVGIKGYSVSLIENGAKIPLDKELLSANATNCDDSTQNANNTNSAQNTLCLSIKKSKHIKNNAKFLTLEVSATDTSKWNFFKGNTTTAQFNINIDTKKPQLAIVANSYKITQGGSALVIFSAQDEHLDKISISNGNLEFKAQPFYKDGFYIALIAWSKLDDNFSAKISAKDRAGNVSIMPINYYLQKRQYKDSTIPLSDAFIDGKISSLVEEIGERRLDEFATKVDIFRYINEEVRQKSFDRIFSVANELPNILVQDFNISPFSPLKNSAVMASFGDHRTFTYANEKVSTSNHMGLDLASIKQAPVLLSNPGIVSLNEFVGIDGNTIVVDHGLGLSSLYAHLTTSNVAVGDELESGIVMANTGNTGLALGDHLHFGMLVQGYEVRTAEWMDAKWIQLNIKDIIAQAKAIIDKI